MKRLHTIYYEIWIVILKILGVFAVLSSIFMIFFTFQRSDIFITRMRENAMSLAWQIYDEFNIKNKNTLSTLASFITASPSGELFVENKILSRLNSNKDLDFWFICDKTGKIVFHSSMQDGTLQEFSNEIRVLWIKGDPIAAPTVFPIQLLEKINPSLANRARIVMQDNDSHDVFPLALFQIVIVPIHYGTATPQGAIIGGHLLNNDTTIQTKYSTKIPGSHLSFSINNMRVATNLSSSIYPSYIGISQPEDVVTAVQQGKRFFGEHPWENGIARLTLSDPLIDLSGHVIGNITIGAPSYGVAELKQYSIWYLLFSIFVSLAFSAFWASAAAKKTSTPIKALSNIAHDISFTERIKTNHLTCVQRQQPSNITEIADLQKCFTLMASHLYKECEKNDAFVIKLKRLSNELQETNKHLEERVKEQTIELRNAVSELQSSNQLKSNFLATMSHELRTPLNSIIGFTEILIDEFYGALNLTQKEYTGIIHSSALHLLQVINDILDLSAIEQNKVILVKEPTNLKALIISALEVVHPLAKKKNIHLELIDFPELPNLMIDPTRIKQVLYNLLTNSIKFTPDSGNISIYFQKTETELAITIVDTGVGIAEKDLPHVFNQFYQIDSFYRRKSGGIGLGLPLSKKLAELHGGRIVLKSKVNQGTIATLYLPLNPLHPSGSLTL